MKEIKRLLKKRKEFIPIERINFNVQHYKPTINKRRQGFLLSLIVLDLVLPMTFSAGLIITKLITKYKPLFLYQ